MGDPTTIHNEKFLAVPSGVPDAAFRMGGEILHLQDETTGFPTFFLFEHFVRWLKEGNPRKQALQLYYSETDMLAYDVEDLAKFSRNAHPMAKMSFQIHPVLSRLKAVIGRGMDQNEMEKFMMSMRRYLGDHNAQYLLLKVRDLSLSKKVTMEKKRTSEGWSVAIKMDDDNSDFKPPETVRFAVPLFKGMEETGAFDLDFAFEFEVAVETTRTCWKLTCPTWEEDFMSVATQVVETAIANAKLEIPVFAGKVNIAVQDNSWSLIHNKPEGLTKLR